MSGTCFDARAPHADNVPPSFRESLRAFIATDTAKRMFDELCQWEDDIVAALNLASEAADRMADALAFIERFPFKSFESRDDYAAVIRDLARNGRFPLGDSQSQERAS